MELLVDYNQRMIKEIKDEIYEQIASHGCITLGTVEKVLHLLDDLADRYKHALYQSSESIPINPTHSQQKLPFTH